MPDRVHRAAATGFGAAADVYEATRPSFPAAAVDWLLAGLRVGAGDEVVEIGAGTGMLTRLLVARGLRIQAVEPVAAMREQLPGIGPGITAIDAVAEALPLPDASAAGAVASQAFHWVDAPRALRELERVLVPGGGIGLLWNHWRGGVAWQQELEALIEPLRGDTPHTRDGAWQAAVEASPHYELAATDSWPWSHRQTLAQAVDRVASISFVAARPTGERAARRRWPTWPPRSAARSARSRCAAT